MKKKSNYPLAIALSSISTIAPFGFLIGCGYFYGQKVPAGNTGVPGSVAKQVPCFWFWVFLVLFIISVIVFILTKTLLANYVQKAIEENEYDEFGVSKKKSFKNLSRKEREAMDLQKMADMERLLSSTVLKKIIKKGSENPEADLARLIGIEPVKEKMNEMIARMRFERAVAEDEAKNNGKKKMNEEKPKGGSMSGRHMVFYGDPGTGKTTVARIITGFLYKYGYIQENKCIEIDGNFLKAGSESGLKTKYLCQRAFNGVLFIDEAYAIVDGTGEYGKEAIATLIKEMEDNRDRFIVILAGYKNDIKRLLDTNEGFKSRIKEYLEFPDYSIEEMCEIMKVMAEDQHIILTQASLDNAAIRFGREKRLSSFGNGRTVRNVLDEAIDKHALNYGSGKLANCAASGWVEEGKPPADNKYRLCGADVSTEPNKAVL